MSLSHVVKMVQMRGKVASSLPAYAVRTAQMNWLQMRGRSTVIDLNFGAHPFKLNYEPLSQGEGARAIFFFRSRYEPLLEFGHIFLKPGDTAMDLGANQGIFANAFGAAVGPEGRVVFVEPIPWQFERVCRNLATNRFSHVKGVEAAISDSIGEAELSLGGGDTSASITHSFGGKSITVKTTTLDQICLDQGLKKVDFVKADVEGEEISTLNGAPAMIARDRPTFCMEINNMDTYDAIMGILAPHGYSAFRFDKTGKLFPVTAPVDWIENLFLLTEEKIEELGAEHFVRG